MKSEKDNTTWSHLYGESEKFWTHRKSRLVVAKGVGGEGSGGE